MINLTPILFFIMGALEQVYNAAMEKPLRVLEIFNDFFGEDRVDMQGFPSLADVRASLPKDSTVDVVKTFISARISGGNGFILVHFPHVRITNEYNRYTEANHMYAKVWIDIDGKIQGRFALNRSEYTVLHFTNNYMHSHVSSIPIHNFGDFQTPCTGSGPINNTICSLARDFDADLWGLFCLELDRYMQVESIAGTPYHRLESLTMGGRGNTYRVFTEVRFIEKLTNTDLGNRERGITTPNSSAGLTYTQVAEFTKYVIDSNILKFAYQEGKYCLAMSPTEYYIKLSNLFIKWYNREWKRGNVNKSLQELLSSGILGKYKFVNNQIVKESNYRIDYQPYIGAKICTFKGQDVVLTISDAEVVRAENNDVYMLKQEIGEYIFTKIFNVINYRYGNNRKQEGDSSSKKVYFL